MYFSFFLSASFSREFAAGEITSVSISVSSADKTVYCVSTGGPATVVTWTRDSVTVTEGTEGTETMLDNPVTAQYTHTLVLVSESVVGNYTCTVANDKPSSASAITIFRGESHIVAM